MPLTLVILPILGGCADVSDAAQPARQEQAAPQYIATMVGRIDSNSDARQIAASTSGIIRSIAVARGSQVQRGQLLFTIDCAPEQAVVAVRQAEAGQASAAAATIMAGSRPEDIARARADVARASSLSADAADRLARAEALVDRGFVSQREIMARRAAATAAQAEVAGALASFERLQHGPLPSERQDARARAAAAHAAARAAQAVHEECFVRSPINGTVLQLYRQAGEDSGAATASPVMAIADLSQLVVRAEAHERDAAALRVGQRADVWIDGDSRRWSGTISEMASIMGRRTARSLDPTDRFDRDSREAFVTVTGTPLPPLVGLRVMVGIRP